MDKTASDYRRRDISSASTWYSIKKANAVFKLRAEWHKVQTIGIRYRISKEISTDRALQQTYKAHGQGQERGRISEHLVCRPVIDEHDAGMGK